MDVFRLVGGAGTGKTTELLSILSKLTSHGIDDPYRIGFVSFTRAARSEAASRAARTYGVQASDLERHGWFRTIHSVCFQALDRPDGMLGDDADSRKFLREEVDRNLSPSDASESIAAQTPPQIALSLWALARNRLEPIETIWREAARVETAVPQLDYCRKVAQKYESAKHLHGKRDFVDLLQDVAGITHSPEHGIGVTMERGSVPELPVWFFDEQQDASALLDVVCKRLIRSPETKYTYVVGDPFQSIYSFGGASSSHFMGWEVSKERVMPKSWRCPAEIHNYGEQLLRPCRDYWDRGIAPADHEGEVIRRDMDHAVKMIDPTQPWLLLARTHYLAAAWQRELDEQGIPWASTQGGGGWVAPVRNAATQTLLTLERRGPITSQEWAEAIKHLPAKLLTRGTKTHYEPQSDTVVELPDLCDHGGTPELISTIESGGWRKLIEKADRYIEAVTKWGEEVLADPPVKVGTIHSVKGSEADNVAVLTGSTKRISMACQFSRDLADEERRIAYVAATRARRRLVLVDPYNTRFLSPLAR